MMLKQWCQTNDHQCLDCRSDANSQILCCKCGKGFRLYHNSANCGVGDVTAHLECTSMSNIMRERLKTRFTITELLQSADNDDHVVFRLTASTPPASNEELHDTRHLPESSPVVSATKWSRSKVQKQPVLPVRNHDTWPAPSWHDEREKAFVMAVENGADVVQPNLHQRALFHAETIPHLVKCQRAQCRKKCQLHTRRHKKMEFPPNRKKNKKTDATNRLLEGAPCSTCTNRIRQGARRLAFWSCKTHHHLNCLMSNHTQIVRRLTTQRWQCTHYSQKTVADSQDDQMASVLEEKSLGVHQYLLRILQWNANG